MRRGLDCGCGRSPALAAMLREAGHRVALFDPVFHPDPAPLAETCDFITCTEAAEHFHRPAEGFDRPVGMLRGGGWLAVMTCFQPDDARFAGWHYRRDPTDVAFCREATLWQITASRGWLCESPVQVVAPMQTPAGRPARP